MATAAKHQLTSGISTTWFAGVALLVVAFLVIAAPGVLPADEAHTGVTLVGP